MVHELVFEPLPRCYRLGPVGTRRSGGTPAGLINSITAVRSLGVGSSCCGRNPGILFERSRAVVSTKAKLETVLSSLSGNAGVFNRPWRYIRNASSTVGAGGRFRRRGAEPTSTVAV